MGQAKLRGTFEQRQAEGVAKREAEEQRKREARKTPAERDRSRRAATLLASVLGMAIAGSSAKGLEIARMAAEYRDP